MKGYFMIVIDMLAIREYSTSAKSGFDVKCDIHYGKDHYHQLSVF